MLNKTKYEDLWQVDLPNDHIIEFKGVSYRLPNWVNWIAQDINGDVFAYSKQPERTAVLHKGTRGAVYSDVDRGSGVLYLTNISK